MIHASPCDKRIDFFFYQLIQNYENMSELFITNLCVICNDDQVDIKLNLKCGRPEWTRTIDLRNVNATL